MQLYDDFHVILDLSRACFTLLKKFFGSSLFDSKLPNNIESQFQSTYRFSICNYQIYLWLTIASMNRLNESFNEAQAAIAEAEKIKMETTVLTYFKFIIFPLLCMII